VEKDEPELYSYKKVSGICAECSDGLSNEEMKDLFRTAAFSKTTTVRYEE